MSSGRRRPQVVNGREPAARRERTTTARLSRSEFDRRQLAINKNERSFDKFCYVKLVVCATIYPAPLRRGLCMRLISRAAVSMTGKPECSASGL